MKSTDASGARYAHGFSSAIPRATLRAWVRTAQVSIFSSPHFLSSNGWSACSFKPSIVHVPESTSWRAMGEFTRFPNLCTDSIEHLAVNPWEKEIPRFSATADALFLAWATILKCYTGDENVTFATESGRTIVDIASPDPTISLAEATIGAGNTQITGVFEGLVRVHHSQIERLIP